MPYHQKALRRIEFCIDEKSHRLDLGDLELTEIPLEILECTCIKWLYLGCNKLHDISRLTSLTKLEWLSLDNNYVTDLTPLTSLTNLKHLSIYDNQFTDITLLKKLPNLITLCIDYNVINTNPNLELQLPLILRVELPDRFFVKGTALKMLPNILIY